MDRSSRIVLSIPPALRDRIAGIVPALVTYDAFAGLFAGAKRSLKIIAPYVDPSFTALLALTQVPVQVLTTVGEGRGMRASPVLERCAALHQVSVRYMTERRDRALLYQMHTKMILADSERAYVGTANLTDTSIHYNLELGLLVEDRRTAGELERFFNTLFERVGVPAKLL